MRHARYHQEDSSEDSFLDVVANVVGVLIILVMLVGAQASRTALMSDTSKVPQQDGMAFEEKRVIQDVEELHHELELAQEEATNSQKALEKLVVQVAKISHESQAYDRQRIELATHRTIIEQDIQRRKALLDEQKQGEFEVQRKLMESKFQLDKLAKEQLSLFAESAVVTEVECLPTPLAKTVEGDSIHLRLKNGLVSVVPFNELIAELTANLTGLRRRLEYSNSVAETIGPIDGYRLKFSVAKFQSSSAVNGPLVGQQQRPIFDQLAEFIPVSEDMGQGVEQSLLPGGTMYRFLREHRHGNSSIVVWLYTDSFDEYRPLKRALWEMGYSFAARPMKPGVHIGASPRGTKAAAQ